MKQPKQLFQKFFHKLRLRKTALPYLGFFILILSICLGILFCYFYFRVSVIQVDSSTEGLVVQGLYGLKNQNMLLLDEKKVDVLLYQQNPGLKDIQVTKEFPHTLHVQFNTEDAVASLQVNTGYFTLANNGRIIAKSREKSSSLPEIHYYQKLNYDEYANGDMVDFKDITASLEFLQKALDLQLKINSIDISSFDMIALKTDKETFLFSIEKSIQDQEYQFETLVRELKLKGQTFETIDVRFDRVYYKK